VTPAENYHWQFMARFRRHAFGWRSQPAILRVKEAVSEIKRVARRDPAMAADGAVSFFERLSPALEHVDSSSGGIGTAVANAVRELVPVIATAPADPKVRDAWLERLWVAHEADEVPYIEGLADYWGELCGSKETAADWAERLVGITRMALSPDPSLHGHFHGTTACLSALYRAERYQEIIDILDVHTIWPHKRWAVKALVAMGKKGEALRYAEACRGPSVPEEEVNTFCESILLSSGLLEEAYQRYGLRAARAGTHLATFRAIAKKYPHKPADELLADLAAATPGEEGKWFAAAKDAGLYGDALALASLSPCDPKVLTRAARDFAESQTSFAIGAGVLAITWLVRGYGYEVTSADVWAAYTNTMKAAEVAGERSETQERVKQLVASEVPGGFVNRVLGGQLGL